MLYRCNTDSTGCPPSDRVCLVLACQYIDWAGVKTKDGFFNSAKAIAYAKSHVTKVVCCLLLCSFFSVTCQCVVLQWACMIQLR